MRDMLHRNMNAHNQRACPQLRAAHTIQKCLSWQIVSLERSDAATESSQAKHLEEKHCGMQFGVLLTGICTRKADGDCLLSTLLVLRCMDLQPSRPLFPVPLNQTTFLPSHLLSLAAPDRRRKCKAELAKMRAASPATAI
jgi:hypothetical protein